MNYILRKSMVLAGLMAAAETRTTVAVRKHEAKASEVVETDDDDEGEEKAGRIVKNPKVYAEGVKTAEEMFDLQKRVYHSLISLAIHVAKLPESDAKDFITGMRERIQKLRDGTKSEPELKMLTNIEGTASRLNRVVKSVHGWITTDKETKKKAHVKGMGQAAVLKILQGKGTWPQKMALLDKPTRAGAQTVINPIQRRLEASGAVADKAGKVAPPSIESVQTLIQVRPQADDEKSKAEAAALAMQVLTSAVRQCPEENLGDLVLAMIQRCSASPSAQWQEFAANARSAMQAAHTIKGKGRIIKGEKVKA